MLTPPPVLVIGNKNYASWCLPPWLLLHHFNIHFEEQNVSIAAPDAQTHLAQYSPTAKLPVLLDEGHAVWDSLAIMEYVNERYLKGTGWPDNRLQRAQARSLCAELHSGLSALNQQLPMNIRELRDISISQSVRQDLTRVDQIWSQCTSQSATGWLFDQFSIADCYFSPLAFVTQTYRLPLSEDARIYRNRLLNLAAMRQWQQAATKETESITRYQAGIKQT